MGRHALPVGPPSLDLFTHGAYSRFLVTALAQVLTQLLTALTYSTYSVAFTHRTYSRHLSGGCCFGATSLYECAVMASGSWVYLQHKHFME